MKAVPLSARRSKMKKFILAVAVVLAMISLPALAGPHEDRAKAVMDNLFDRDVPIARVRAIVASAFLSYQAWLPEETVVVGTESYVSGTETNVRDVFETRTQDPTAWTNERAARFWLRVVRKEMKGKVSEAAEQQARVSAQATYDASVSAAGRAATSDL